MRGERREFGEDGAAAWVAESRKVKGFSVATLDMMTVAV